MEEYEPVKGHQGTSQVGKWGLNLLGAIEGAMQKIGTVSTSILPWWKAAPGALAPRHCRG